MLAVSSLAAAQTNQADAKLNPPGLGAPDASVLARASLTYHLRNMLGRPVSGISVEVRNLQTHSEITSAMTGTNGEVEFDGLAPGRYEITVAGGLLPPRREVQVDGGNTQFFLELPLSPPNTREMVSVQELTVPRRAKEALNAATEAWQKQDWTKARLETMHALSLHPDYAAALSVLGYLDLQDGNLELACAALKRAIEVDPNFGLAYLTLGSTYNSMNRYDAALEALSVVPSVSSDTWQLHYEIARSYVGLHEFELGLVEINYSERLAQQDPAVLHVGKAHVLLGLHRNAEAATELKTVLRKEPKGPFAPEARSLLTALSSQKHN